MCKIFKPSVLVVSLQAGVTIDTIDIWCLQKCELDYPQIIHETSSIKLPHCVYFRGGSFYWVPFPLSLWTSLHMRIQQPGWGYINPDNVQWYCSPSSMITLKYNSHFRPFWYFWQINQIFYYISCWTTTLPHCSVDFIDIYPQEVNVIPIPQKWWNHNTSSQ